MSQISFQGGVAHWLLECFSPAIVADKTERADRFIEEESVGYPAERVMALLSYVYGRELGQPAQEVGGTMVTLAAFCVSHGIDMDEAAKTELARVWTKIEAIRAKQAAKPTGSALPIAQAAPLAPSVAVKASPDFPHILRSCVDMLKSNGFAAANIVEVAERALSAQVQDGATHRHKKRGSEYALIGVGKMQAENWQVSVDGFDQLVDMQEVAIYRSIDDGSLWVRPIDEFNDGRFEPLPAAPTKQEGGAA